MLNRSGPLIFGGQGVAVPDWKKRLPHCNGATANTPNPDHFFTSYFPKVLEKYDRKIVDQSERKICFAQWLSFIKPIQELDQDKLECTGDGGGPGLGQRITRRCEEDQASIKPALAYHQGDTSGLDPSCPLSPTMATDVAVLVRLDNNDFMRNEGILDRLEQILKNDPGASMAAWLIFQHADQDRDLQRLALTRYQSLLQQGLVAPKEVAWLADRNMIADQNRQLYGSHTKCVGQSAVFEPPLDDPMSADQRRAEIGLPPARELLDERSSQTCGGR